MANGLGTILPKVMEKYSAELIDAWLKAQKAMLPSGQAEDAEQTDQSRRFITAIRQGIESGHATNLDAAAWAPAKGLLEEFSRSKALKGASPSETATFVFSLKSPLFDLLRRELGTDAARLAQETWTATLLLDKLGLYTTEIHQKSREEVITRQQQELLELSTPVVQLWEGILALPLIGTLDSARTQVVMENLLQEIVDTGAEIAIIDITGVPTVDTLVAQHLLKTVSAARLMGADCVISGIRPQIAQTIVHLGVQLDVVSKANMADAFALALRRIGKRIVGREAAAPAAAKAANAARIDEE